MLETGHIGDHAVVALITLVVPVYQYYSYPRFLRAVRAGRPGARLWAYRRALALQWILAGLVLFGWFSAQRSAAELGLGFYGGWRWWLGVGIVGAAAGLLTIQLRAAARDGELRKLVEAQLEPVKEVLPVTRVEAAHFSALSLTAGICEELIYRGFLIWYASQWIGVSGAVVLSAAIFGLGHLYQGRRGMIKIFFVGLALALLYLLTRSLWLPIAFHAYMDLVQGRFAHRCLCGGLDASDSPSVEAESPTSE